MDFPTPPLLLKMDKIFILVFLQSFMMYFDYTKSHSDLEVGPGGLGREFPAPPAGTGSAPAAPAGPKKRRDRPMRAIPALPVFPAGLIRGSRRWQSLPQTRQVKASVRAWGL